MDWDQRDSKRQEPQRLELDCNNVPVRRSFTETNSERINQSFQDTTVPQATESLEWRPCQYCGHGYRNITRLERHLEEHHGAELRVQGAIQGRMSAADR